MSSPEQIVVSPVTGRFLGSGPATRDGPADSALRSLSILSSSGYTVFLVYVLPDPSLRAGAPVNRGDRIGTAQDIRPTYPGITNHVHVQVFDRNFGRKDPTPFFGW